MTEINDNYEAEKEYFDKNYNISYYDESLPKPSNELIFQHYVSSCVIYAFLVLLILFNPFYVHIYAKHEAVKMLLIYTYLGYIIFAPIFLFLIKPKTIYASHSIEVMNYLLKIIKRDGLEKDYNSVDFIKWLTPTYKQKQSIILYFIKFFFAPQLILWSVGHFVDFKDTLKVLLHFNNALSAHPIKDTALIIAKYRNLIYLTLFHILYFFDCFVFTIGYCTELTILKNRIRTVEMSALGLFFCLACYPPFNKISSYFVPWNHSETALTLSFSPLSVANWIMYIGALILIFIYVSASIALFTKASNLTNRGTVSIFPYNIVRHPAYATKIGLWCFTSIIMIKFFVLRGDFKTLILYLICMSIWSFIYYMRAITEERHLMLDPEYRAYTKKVKYKFIPFVW